MFILFKHKCRKRTGKRKEFSVEGDAVSSAECLKVYRGIFDCHGDWGDGAVDLGSSNWIPNVPQCSRQYNKNAPL